MNRHAGSSNQKMVAKRRVGAIFDEKNPHQVNIHEILIYETQERQSEKNIIYSDMIVQN